MTNEAYDTRSILISDFYNNYDMKVSESDMGALQNFLDTADAIKEQQEKEDEIKELIVNNFKYTEETLTEDTIKIEYKFVNDSMYDFDDFYVEFYYFNSDGAKTDNWTNVYDDIQAGETFAGQSTLYLLDSDIIPTGTVKVGELSFSVDGTNYSNVQSWLE